MEIRARRDEQVPLTLAVTDEAGGVAGLTATVAIRRGETSNSYLDFADLTFKAAGWTTKNQALTDNGAGFYVLTAALDLDLITNLSASTRFLAAEYTISGAAAGVAVDVIALDDSAPKVDDLHAIANNRLEVNLGTQALELYDEAGVAVIRSWDLETDGGEPVTTQKGVQTKRGIPSP